MANLNFNKVIIGGRLTGDPELKTTPNGVSVTTFNVAVNRRFGKDGEAKTDFFTVTAWRQTAEFVTKHFHKGSCICVDGSLQNRSWEGTDGQKHYVTEIVAENAYFVDSKDEDASPAPAEKKTAEPAETQTTLEEIDDDEALPF